MEIKLQASDGTTRTLTLVGNTLRYKPAPDDMVIRLAGVEWTFGCDPAHVVVGPGVPGGAGSLS